MTLPIYLHPFDREDRPKAPLRHRHRWDQIDGVGRGVLLENPRIVKASEVSFLLLDTNKFTPAQDASNYPNGLSYMYLSASPDPWPHQTGVVETLILARGSGHRIVQRCWNKTAAGNASELVYRRTRNADDTAWFDWHLEKPYLSRADTGTAFDLAAAATYETALTDTISLHDTDFRAHLSIHGSVWAIEGGTSDEVRMRLRYSTDGGATLIASRIQSGKVVSGTDPTQQSLSMQWNARDLAVTGDIVVELQVRQTTAHDVIWDELVLNTQIS